MSTQRGNIKKSRPQKYQNKSAFKNVYHDTSKQTQQIVSTVAAGVCGRCKDCIDWKIKYKKYKPLTQAKTCAMCKQKCVKQAYMVYCAPCSQEKRCCAKCGEKKEIVLKPEPSAAQQASEDRELQFELEQLPERKRRTFMRLQEKGLLTSDIAASKLKRVDDEDEFDDDSFEDDDDESAGEAENEVNDGEDKEQLTEEVKALNEKVNKTEIESPGDS